MIGRGRAVLAAVFAAVMLLAAACQPLPHPFEDDRPPSALLKIRDAIAVSVAPVVGDPAPVAAKLGDAMVKALLTHDVAATNKTLSIGSYQLFGRVMPDNGTQKTASPKAGAAKPDAAKPDAGKPKGAKPAPKAAADKPKKDAAKPAKTNAKPDNAKPDVPKPDAQKPDAQKPDAGKPAGNSPERSVKVLWRLYGPDGHTVAERTVTAKAKTADWDSADNAAVERLAAASAESVSPLFLEEGPKEAAVDAGDNRTRVTIGKISGAPGDGERSLTDAITAVLKRQDIAVVGGNDKPDLRIECDVTVDPAKSNKQHVKIVWRVRRADGAELGTVGQENDVPRGTLDGPWGDLAYSVALAANDGLMQVVARGAPAPAGAPPPPAAQAGATPPPAQGGAPPPAKPGAAAPAKP